MLGNVSVCKPLSCVSKCGKAESGFRRVIDHTCLTGCASVVMDGRRLNGGAAYCTQAYMDTLIITIKGIAAGMQNTG